MQRARFSRSASAHFLRQLTHSSSGSPRGRSRVGGHLLRQLTQSSSGSPRGRSRFAAAGIVNEMLRQTSLPSSNGESGKHDSHVHKRGDVTDSQAKAIGLSGRQPQRVPTPAGVGPQLTCISREKPRVLRSVEELPTSDPPSFQQGLRSKAKADHHRIQLAPEYAEVLAAAALPQPGASSLSRQWSDPQPMSTPRSANSRLGAAALSSPGRSLAPRIDSLPDWSAIEAVGRDAPRPGLPG